MRPDSARKRNDPTCNDVHTDRLHQNLKDNIAAKRITYITFRFLTWSCDVIVLGGMAMLVGN